MFTFVQDGDAIATLIVAPELDPNATKSVDDLIRVIEKNERCEIIDNRRSKFTKQ